MADADSALIADLRAALAEERRLLRTLLDHLPDLVYVKNRDSRFLIANLATARMMGVADGDGLIGRCDHDFYPVAMADAFRADEVEIMAGNQAVMGCEERTVDPEGQEHWILTTKAPLHDESGRVIGLIGIGQDITARRRIEDALRAENEALRRRLGDEQAGR